MHKAIPNIAWQETKDIKIGSYTKRMNEYFIANPDHILGELDVVKMYERMGITCKASGILRDKLIEVFLKTKKS